MFSLYTVEESVFGFEDYRALIDQVHETRARSVLEFGPGCSTLAFIEAGCETIETCEHDSGWRDQAERRFKRHDCVRVRSYTNSVPPVVFDLGRRDFDLALVDSPNGEEKRRVRHPGQEDCSRFNTVMFALSHAPVVLLHDAFRPGEQKTLERLSDMGHFIRLIPTKKGFARIERG